MLDSLSFILLLDVIKLPTFPLPSSWGMCAMWMWCDEISIFHTRTREAFSSFFLCCFSLLFVMPYPCIVPINPLHLSSSLSSTHTTHTHVVEHRALNDDAATLAVSCPLYAIDSGSARKYHSGCFRRWSRYALDTSLLIRAYWFCHISPSALTWKWILIFFYKSTHTT